MNDTEVVDNGERIRLSWRESLRAQIAQRGVLLDRRNAITEEIARLDAQAAEAADAHSAKCEPLQAELAGLERQAIGRVRGRLPADPEQDGRRVELSRAIEQANSELRDACDRVTRLKDPLAVEVHTLTGKFATMPTSQDLLRDRYANPAMLARKDGLSEFIKMLNQLREGTARKLEAAETNLRLSGEGSLRVAKWHETLSVIGQHDRAAQQEQNELMRRMIDE